MKPVEYLPLTKTEADQLLAYTEWAEREGTYYGDKRWFDKRHNHIKKMLRNMLLLDITQKGGNNNKLLKGGSK